MFKVIVILLIIYYLWTRVGKYFIRTFSSDEQTNSRRSNYSSRDYNRYQEAEPRVNFRSKEKKDTRDFKGGEYVDYEEVE